MRMLATAMMMTSVLLTSGCAPTSLEDEFILGKNRISCANQTITLEVPFEMGVQGRMADMAPKDSAKVSAEGNNKHIQILVTGELAAEKNVMAQMAAASELMNNEESVANLTEIKESITLGNMNGVCMTFSFDDISRSSPVSLTVKEYMFKQGDVLWRVIYQYRTEDPVGKALTERVEGKIVEGVAF